MDQKTNVDGFWTLRFTVGEDSIGEESKYGAAVITGPKVQGSNPEWFWSAHYCRVGQEMTFTLDRGMLFPGEGALTGVWAYVFKGFTLYGEIPKPKAKEFEVAGFVNAFGAGSKLKIHFTRVNL